MKRSAQTIRRRDRLAPLCGRNGIAILTVLAVVSLMSVLTLSMLSMSESVSREAAGHVREISARGQADTAFGIVLGQLRSATMETLEGGDPAPWATQPGAAHVFNMDGTLREIRKLYSAAELSTESPEDLEKDTPVAWRKVPGQYVDLNEPVTGPDGGLSFPIADPRVALGADAAEGFGYEVDRAPEGTVGVGQAADEDGSNLRLPMPVRWIYQLRDGTLGVLDDAGVFTPFNPDAGGATRENPITGRFAFWTDDETAKINVNTAGEGAPWDTPRLTTRQDEALARYQPMRGEFYRYPGHPAGVCLSTVLFPGKYWQQPGDGDEEEGAPLTEEEARALWEMAPGTLTDSESTSLGGRRRAPGLDKHPGHEVSRPWHLYNSPVEAALLETREIRQGLSGPRVDAQRRMTRGNFLLTTASRSPETSLFGYPRVSMWPVHDSVQPGVGIESAIQRASGIDATLALASTAGGRKYYVQRSDPGNGSADFQFTGNGDNVRLFNWLSNLIERPAPGFLRPGLTSTFAEKYGAGPEGDARNILALMMDYIRTTNLADGNLDKEYQFSIVCPGNWMEGYGQISPLDMAEGATPEARWKESEWYKPRGLGRIATLNEAVFLFTCRAWVDENGTIQGSPSGKAAREKLTRPGDREMEAAILYEMFVPGQGWAESRPRCSLAVAGVTPGNPVDFQTPIPAMYVNEAPLIPRNIKELRSLRNVLERRNRLPGEWIASGGNAGIRSLLGDATVFEPFVVKAGTSDNLYLNFTGTGDAGLRIGIFDLPGVFEIPSPGRRARNPGLSDLVQVVEIHFPAIPARAVRLPGLPKDGTPLTLDERLTQAFEGKGRLFSEQDVVQSLVPAHGDARLLAGQRLVGVSRDPARDRAAPAFVPHPGYGRARQAHSLRQEAGQLEGGAERGPAFFADIPQPAPGVADYPIRPWENTPVVLQAANGSGVRTSTSAEVFEAGRLDGGKRGSIRPDVTGDFDTGVGRAADGSYVNRPDDGELRGYAIGTPYFDPPPSDPHNAPPVSAAATSPNRLIPGPGVFGSLPTGVKARTPWQTLLFRPWLEGSRDPAQWLKARDHYGWSWPRDWLLLDLFWMPVVEPYGLSTALDTAGKINLNHRVAPFFHIKRATALHALLKGERLIAIPDHMADQVKRASGFSDVKCRHRIDEAGTVKLWEEVAKENGRLFLSPGEVCELPLVPKGVEPTFSALTGWWRRHRLTGDNLKERPYASLHARLTTRGNVFRVHVRAESLQKAPSTPPNRWVEGKDTVAAVWRGSSLLERCVNPAELPDYVANPDAPRVDQFYTWRFTREERVVGQ